MKAKAGFCLLILFLCCLELNASVFSSRKGRQTLIESTVGVEEDDEESMSSQVPEVKAKAPKIYSWKKSKDDKDDMAEESASLVSESAVASEAISGGTLLIIEEEDVLEEEPAPLPEQEESLFAEVEAIGEEEPVIETVELVVKEETESVAESAVVPSGPSLGEGLADALVLALSLAVTALADVALRKALGSPLTSKASLLAALLSVFVPFSISMLAAGWSLLWLCYSGLLLTFFIFRSGSQRQTSDSV